MASPDMPPDGASRPQAGKGDEPARRGVVARFFFPRLDRRFAVRVLVVAGAAFVFFRYVCIPLRIQGASMEPTYRDGGVSLGFLHSYHRRAPRRHDVVMVRMAGTRMMYLKRVVALAGEEIAFLKGQALVNGEPVDESYVVYGCDWDIPPRRVEEGHLYVVGDNRSMPQQEHVFGQVHRDRIAGRPLW